MYLSCPLPRPHWSKAQPVTGREKIMEQLRYEDYSSMNAHALANGLHAIVSQ
nr:MAG TPA: hypothetical protein [Caudoviricetes sp.]